MQNIIKFLPSQLSTQPKILELLPDNAVHIYCHEKSGELPKRVSIGNHPVAWVEEVYQWVEDKISTGPLLSNEKNSDGE